MSARPAKRTRSARRGAPSSPSVQAAWLGPALLVAATLAAVALYLHREWDIAGLWGFSLDDAWIHAAFARNLITGHGYAFNPGEPVSGSTGPLYSVVLAVLYGITGEMIWSAKIFGVACHVAAVLLFYRAAQRLLPTLGAALAAGLFLALSPPLLWASLSGMEISLYLVFACWGLERYVAGRDVAATLAWSLGVWVRPDGLFLVALSLLGPRATLPKRLLAAAAPLVPFFAFNLALGGSPFPQTVAAKTHIGIDLAGRSWRLLREWAAIWGVPYTVFDELEHPLLFLPLILIGIVLLAKRRPILVLYALGLPLALSLFRENSSSHKRYILYVIPFCILLAMVALGWIMQRVGQRRAAAVFLVVVVACGAWQAVLVNRQATTHGWNVQNINMMQRILGLTAEKMTSPDDTIAASDIGAIGYFSNRRVIDLMGLVSAPRPLPENLSVYRPKLLIVIIDWFAPYARPDSASNLVAFYDADSTHKYTPTAVVELHHNTICSGDQMVVFLRQGVTDPAPELFFQRF